MVYPTHVVTEVQKFGYNTSVLVPNVLLAAALYFLAVLNFRQNVSARYVQVSLLSAVVLVSAYLMLSKQVQNNTVSAMNSQNLRYFNWLVDVPLLLFIFCTVLQTSRFVTGAMVFMGVVMVLCGYVSVQTTNNIYMYLSIAAYLLLAATLGKVSWGRRLFVLFLLWLAAWTVYLIPYGIEYRASAETYQGEVEIWYGVADVTSKIVLPLLMLRYV
jgi:bacteriorhodopsin